MLTPGIVSLLVSSVYLSLTEHKLDQHEDSAVEHYGQFPGPLVLHDCIWGFMSCFTILSKDSATVTLRVHPAAARAESRKTLHS